VNDDVPLLPPIALINEKLTVNQRERRRLRTLLKLAVEEADDRRHQPRPEAARPEAVAR
jgi:hypothetical protein